MSRLPSSDDSTVQQHFEHEAAADISEQQRDERSEHPAQRRTAAPAGNRRAVSSAPNITHERIANTVL